MDYRTRHPEARRKTELNRSEKLKADRKASRTARECQGCGIEFIPNRTNQIRCKRGCRQYQRKWQLKQSYGITENEYRRIARSQNDRCAACGGLSEDVLHVDHDHQSGQIRGLLCRNCNIGIGHFFDSPDHLVSAALYLIRTS